MKTPLWLVAASLIAIATTSPAASAMCTGSLDPSERCFYPDTGGSDGVDETVVGPVQPCPANPAPAPQPGLVPDAEWYSQREGYLVCTYVDQWENLVVDTSGDVAWRAGEGAVDLADGFAIGPPTTTLVADATAVATNAVHDGCADLTSPSFGPCGSGNATPGQACGAPLSNVPNPIGTGGFLGDGLKNSDAAYQAVCAFEAGVAGGTPAPGTVVGIVTTTATNVQNEVLAAVMPIQTQATTRTTTLASDTITATECMIFGLSSC